MAAQIKENTDMVTKTVTRQASQVFATLIESVNKCPDSVFGLDARDSHESIRKIAMHIGGSLENAFMTASFREGCMKYASTRASGVHCVP